MFTLFLALFFSSNAFANCAMVQQSLMNIADNYAMCLTRSRNVVGGEPIVLERNKCYAGFQKDFHGIPKGKCTFSGNTDNLSQFCNPGVRRNREGNEEDYCQY